MVVPKKNWNEPLFFLDPGNFPSNAIKIMPNVISTRPCYRSRGGKTAINSVNCTGSVFRTMAKFMQISMQFVLAGKSADRADFINEIKVYKKRYIKYKKGIRFQDSIQNGEYFTIQEVDYYAQDEYNYVKTS